MNCIDVKGLRYAYPDGHVALSGVNLAVERGQRVALLGPNGAGKTTLVLHLNGILLPQVGSVSILGRAVERGNVHAIRAQVGVVFQDPDDQLFMPTVEADVAFGPANLGLRDEELQERVDAALASVGAGNHRHRPPHHLSLGEKKNVALAGVLAMHPEILVLDEPTANLDPATRREMIDLLRSFDATMVVVTHDILLAAQLCERSVVMNAGTVVADSPTVDLLRDEALLAANRLELPFGFDPAAVAL